MNEPDTTVRLARTLRRSTNLALRMSALDIADRWFSRWIVLHRPIAMLLFGVTTLHVLAHYAYAA